MMPLKCWYKGQNKNTISKVIRHRLPHHILIIIIAYMHKGGGFRATPPKPAKNVYGGWRKEKNERKGEKSGKK